MVGFDTSDDAAVYRISDEVALLLTVDFFTPIVDDPYDFGRITAANALSDVYAMGGKPLATMNLLAFPCKMDPGVVAEGIETREELVTVRELGVRYGQGFLLAVPEPPFPEQQVFKP